MTGIKKLDNVLSRMRKHQAFIEENGSSSHIGHYAADIETAVNEFLASKKSFYCTNTECPIKKALSEEVTK